MTFDPKISTAVPERTAPVTDNAEPDLGLRARDDVDPVKPEEDETPEYPLSAPLKPQDPERRSEQSKAETAGLIGEDERPDV